MTSSGLRARLTSSATSNPHLPHTPAPLLDLTSASDTRVGEESAPHVSLFIIDGCIARRELETLFVARAKTATARDGARRQLQTIPSLRGVGAHARRESERCDAHVRECIRLPDAHGSKGLENRHKARAPKVYSARHIRSFVATAVSNRDVCATERDGKWSLRLHAKRQPDA